MRQIGGPTVVAALALVLASLTFTAAASARATDLCKETQSIVENEFGVGSTTHVFTNEAGFATYCEIGSSSTKSAVVAEKKNVTSSSFQGDEQAQRGKAVSGVGAPAFLTSLSNGFHAIWALKKSTEVEVGAPKASTAKLIAAMKAILPLVH